MTRELQRIKVWDRTTRIFHWLNAISVLTLICMGTLILNAKLFGIEGDAKVLLKELHSYVGYVFVFNLVWRLIWAFVGNHFARWRQFLPFHKGYLNSLSSYFSKSSGSIRQQYLGHNPVARLIIAAFFLLLSVQAITGLLIAGTDLYQPPFGSYFAEWVTEGDATRLSKLKPGDKSQIVESAYNEMRAFRKPISTTHVYAFYALCILILIHIFGVVVTEIKEKNGLISAMITGEKVFDESPVDIKSESIDDSG